MEINLALRILLLATDAWIEQGECDKATRILDLMEQCFAVVLKKHKRPQTALSQSKDGSMASSLESSPTRSMTGRTSPEVTNLFGDATSESTGSLMHDRKGRRVRGVPMTFVVHDRLQNAIPTMYLGSLELLVAVLRTRVSLMQPSNHRRSLELVEEAFGILNLCSAPSDTQMDDKPCRNVLQSFKAQSLSQSSQWHASIDELRLNDSSNWDPLADSRLWYHYGCINSHSECYAAATVCFTKGLKMLPRHSGNKNSLNSRVFEERLATLSHLQQNHDEAYLRFSSLAAKSLDDKHRLCAIASQLYSKMPCNDTHTIVMLHRRLVARIHPNLTKASIPFSHSIQAAQKQSTQLLSSTNDQKLRQIITDWLNSFHSLK